MLEVLALILAAGRLPASEPFHRAEIAKLLAGHRLDDMLRGIPDDESRELLYDMMLLNLA